jgi:hypothetical protein
MRDIRQNGAHQVTPTVREHLQTTQARLCHGEDGEEGPLLPHDGNFPNERFAATPTAQALS